MAERVAPVRVLLADDEEAIQTLLTYPLEKDGYEVVSVGDGRQALDRFAESHFDLVVLDVMMPRVDGLEVCRRIRAKATVPIIMLTAKAEEADRVLGLDIGADDYITKPFSLREFRSRVRAALRRASMTPPAGADLEPLAVHELEIAPRKRSVKVRGEDVVLTFVEFEILESLARSPGIVFSREQLLTRIWGDSAYRDPRTIDVHIRHLREKIERDPKEPEYLFTVRGAGYRFRDAGRRLTLRGLRTQLVAVVVLAVAVACGLVAVVVMPGISAAVREQRLDSIEQDARRLVPEIRRAVEAGAPAAELRRLVARGARVTTSRVAVVGVAETPITRQTFVKADSGAPDADRLQLPAALTAAAEGRPARAVEAGPQGHVGQVALPLPGTGAAGQPVEAVLVASRPLDGETEVAGWVGSRLLLGTALGLLAALLAGLLLARHLERRIARLSSAARRAAAGDLATPFPTAARTEFGGLGSSLEEMRRQLAELDSARKRFIATASHELRTPLFSLGGFLELLEDEDLSEADRRRFTAQLREQVGRLQELATDLLDLSRMEAGSLELHRQPVDLRAIARSVAGEFAPAVAAHEAHLELRMPDRELHALCDPDRVRQVLRILIANAIGHTPRGTDIVIAAAMRDGQARLSVADHGPGISRTVLPTIFEPFATTDDMQGTGLGLTIARELATRMQGELRVESRPGLTRFTLDLAPAHNTEIPSPG